jgi:tetratricopeptide (TPR) repeat protein
LLTAVTEIALSLQRPDPAETQIQRAIEIRTDLLGETHRDTLESRSRLVNVRVKQGRWDEAEAGQRDIVDTVLREIGEDDRMAALMMNRLGVILHDRYKTEEAIEWYERALASARSIGFDSMIPDVVGNIGFSHQELGR